MRQAALVLGDRPGAGDFLRCKSAFTDFLHANLELRGDVEMDYEYETCHDCQTKVEELKYLYVLSASQNARDSKLSILEDRNQLQAWLDEHRLEKGHKGIAVTNFPLTARRE